MKLQLRRRDHPEVGLTPLIDVVFLLLIFFMVSTTFTRESEITINLPEAAATETEIEQLTIDLVVDSQGRYYVNNQQLINTQIETLMEALRRIVDGLEDAVLIISADAQTPHQAVITAMDAARQTGIVRVSLATRDPGN
jgi:biopolymer transport protein ExbD